MILNAFFYFVAYTSIDEWLTFKIFEEAGAVYDTVCTEIFNSQLRKCLQNVSAETSEYI